MKHLFYPFLLAALLLCTACDKEPGGDKEPDPGNDASLLVGTWVADYQEHPTGDGHIERREVDGQTLTFTAQGTFTATQYGAVVSYGTYRLDGNRLEATYITESEEEGTASGSGPNVGYDPKPGSGDDDNDAFLPGTGGTRATVSRTSILTVLLLTEDRFAFTETEEDGYVYTIYFHRLTAGGDDDDDDDEVNYPSAGDPGTARIFIAGTWRFDRQETVSGGSTETDWFDNCRLHFSADGTFVNDIAGSGRYDIFDGGSHLMLNLIYDDGETLCHTIERLNNNDLILSIGGSEPDGVKYITYLTKVK